MIEIMNALKTLLVIGVILYAAIVRADTPTEIAALDRLVGCSPRVECGTEGAVCEGYNPREVFMHDKTAVVYEEQLGVCMKDGAEVGAQDGK